MFIKLGEAIEISRIEDASSCIPSINPDILDNFKKFAVNLKKIAPRAEDFLYFSAVMMHAAEAAALNEDGTQKLTISGEPVKVGWDKSQNTWKWTTNDPNTKAYKNSNGDIFPEEELVKAYKKWVGKPLCIDHKSSSVDHVRGFIVDTYYDRNLKRVIALCALDKKNYPDLARKVSTGYSSSVSMGTAVGRAICSDCGRMAKSEADFCEHMKYKSGYGEINIDLNPIELSIVVNGADPKAHIKNIIAAANTLNNYVSQKDEELHKAAQHYSATILLSNDSPENPEDVDTTKSVRINGDSLDELKKSFEEAIKNLEAIKEDTNNATSNQSQGSVEMAETDLPNNTDFGLAPPHARYASDSTAEDADENTLSELKKITASIESKLSHMKHNLDKLTNTSITTNIQEENMSGSNINKKGYFQGAGGENEPTPGQPKYTKDPLNEHLRNDGDKHMDADDTGPVDGLHPGVDSAGVNELERKKMLARAESEDRAMRRTAIVDMAKKALEQKKLAYFQQGEKNPQEPTPGKTKYAPDKLNEDLREDSDKQMVGQKPFPGVGSIDGLHPSPNSADTTDELKRKQLLSRAGLRARFVKASNNDGTQDLGKSAWEVFQGDKLLLTASVSELSGGRSGLLYDSIATKDFGAKLIEKIKSQGASKINSLIKSAQTPTPPPAPPAAEGAGEPIDLPEDSGKSGDPKETALELSEQIRDTSSDLVEAVRALTGEQAEMGADEAAQAAQTTQQAPEMGAAASSDVNSSTLNTLRKELNGALTHAMKEAIAELNDHKQELDMIADMYETGKVSPANTEFVGSIVENAVEEAKTAVADGFKLMTAFVKYARGTKAIVKRAEIEAELQSLASEASEEAEDSSNADDSSAPDSDDSNDSIDNLMSDTDLNLLDIEGELDLGSEELEGLEAPESDLDMDLGGDIDPELEGILNEDSTELESLDVNDATMTQEELSKLPAGTKLEDLEIKQASVDTLAGRSALRAKLAADTLKTSPHLHEAHPKGSFTTDLDVKPTGNLAEVEDLEDEHDAVMNLAKAPPKVRKEAEAIHTLISEGKLDPNDLDALISEGLDKDAVAYYKKYWGQVDGGSEFASELVKEHVKAEMEVELNTYRVKIARAYELAYDMVDRGLCHNDRNAVSAQVDEIMKFNDDSFDSLKRVVAKHEPTLRKEAGHMPQVGMIGSGENNSSGHSEDTLVAQLESVLSKTTKKMF